MFIHAEMPAHRVIAPEPVPACDIMEVERKIRNLPYEHELPICTTEWMNRKLQEEEVSFYYYWPDSVESLMFKTIFVSYQLLV